MASEAAPLLSTLVERLRGIYRLGVNDGAGLLDGKNTFTRDFGTTPIKSEAADRIEALEAALSEAISWHESRAKSLSKQPPGGDRDWRRLEHCEERDRLSAALSVTEGEK